MARPGLFFRTMMREDEGSEQHKTTVVGDTIGDPFKDTSGPSLNILIKLMSMVSIVMAGLTVALA
jgi:K(+)-stimulated pyrophosphate-energized sodium pump